MGLKTDLVLVELVFVPKPTLSSAIIPETLFQKGPHHPPPTRGKVEVWR